MNLIETRNHIIKTSNGNLELMQEVALRVIDKKIEEEFVKNWAVNNKEEVIKFNQLVSRFGSVTKLYDDVAIIKKHADRIRMNQSKEKNIRFALYELLNKIKKL